MKKQDHKHILAVVVQKSVCADHAHNVMVPQDIDNVNHPKHYQPLFHMRPLECIELCRLLGFELGNAIKYVWRAGQKGDWREDLKKASWYLERHTVAPNHFEAVIAHKLSLLMVAETPLEVAKLAVIRAICNMGDMPEAVRKVRDVKAILEKMEEKKSEKPVEKKAKKEQKKVRDEKGCFVKGHKSLNARDTKGRFAKGNKTAKKGGK